MADVRPYLDRVQPDVDRVQPGVDRVQEPCGELPVRPSHATRRYARDARSHEYSVPGEELAEEYATDPMELENETESLGDVFDRLSNERFESATDVREAIYGALTGRAGDMHEFTPERDLESLDDETSRDPE